MRRFSIGKLMLVIALLALNCAAICEFARQASSHRRADVVMGFLPLANAILLGSYFLARQYRITWKPRELRRKNPWFVGMCLVCLCLTVLFFFWNEDIYERYTAVAGHPIYGRLKYWGLARGDGKRADIYLTIPAILGVIFSGPAILISYATASVMSCFKVVHREVNEAS
jgi:hypothetical protein